MADKSLQKLQEALNCEPDDLNRKDLVKTVNLFQEEYQALSEDIHDQQAVDEKHKGHVQHLKASIEILREHIRELGSRNAGREATIRVMSAQVKRLRQ